MSDPRPKTDPLETQEATSEEQVAYQTDYDPPMTQEQIRNRALSYPEIGKNRIPFRSNKSVIYTYTAFLVLLIILYGSTIATTSTITKNIFYESDTDEMLKNSDKSEFKRTNKASIGLAVGSLGLVIGLIICYFWSPGGIRYSFDYSGRLAEDLATVTQGPDRLKRASGLLSYYLYPDEKERAKRAAAANDILGELKGSYEDQLGGGYTGDELDTGSYAYAPKARGIVSRRA